MNFIQTKRRKNYDTYQDKKFKKYARRAIYEDNTEDSETEYVHDDRNEGETLHVLRLSSKDEQQKRKPQKGEQTKDNSIPQSDSLTEMKEMLKSLAGKVEELQKDLTSRVDTKQSVPMVGKSGVLCYACKERGHISRDCPIRQHNQRPRHEANGQKHIQGGVEIRGDENGSPLN